MRGWIGFATCPLLAGFAPWLNAVLWFFLDDRWQMTQANEGNAWVLILGLGFIGALCISVACFKAAPAASAFVGFFGVCGVLLPLYSMTSSSFGPSSKQDDDALLLWEYWLNGGWIGLVPALLCSVIVAASAVARRRPAR